MMNPPMRSTHRPGALSLLLPILAGLPALPACTSEALNEQFMQIDDRLDDDEGRAIFTGVASPRGRLRIRLDGKLVVTTCDPESTPDVRDPECDSSGHVLQRVVIGGGGGQGFNLPAGSHALQLEDDDGNVVIDLGVVALRPKEYTLFLTYDVGSGIGHKVMTTRGTEPVGEKITVRVINLSEAAGGATVMRCPTEGACEPLKTGIAFGELWEQEIERSPAGTVEVRFADGTTLGRPSEFDLSRQCNALTFFPNGDPVRLGLLPFPIERDFDCADGAAHL